MEKHAVNNKWDVREYVFDDGFSCLKKSRKYSCLSYKKSRTKKVKNIDEEIDEGGEKKHGAPGRGRGRTWKSLIYNIEQSVLILSGDFLIKITNASPTVKGGFFPSGTVTLK